MNRESPDAESGNQSEYTDKFFDESRRRFTVNTAGRSDIGRRRKQNEDHFVITRRTRRREILSTNLPEEFLEFESDEAYAFLVADGIGGARFGDLASQMALETALEASGAATSWLMKLRDMDAQQVKQRANAYIDRIQRKFQDFGRENPAAREMGTTLTCAYLLAPHAIIVQVGDSRAYLFRNNALTQLTRDQTLAQLLMDEGVDHEHARTFGHVLLNSLGANSEQIDSEVLHLEMVHGDRLLLCTDGLSDLVDDEAMAKVLAENDVDASCDKLIEMANENGGRDNITVIIGELLDHNQVSTREFKVRESASA